MLTFLIWCILFVACWALAIAGVVIYPFVWLILLPFRIVGIAVGGALDLVWSIVMLPFFGMSRLGRVKAKKSPRSRPIPSRDRRERSSHKLRRPPPLFHHPPVEQ